MNRSQCPNKDSCGKCVCTCVCVWVCLCACDKCIFSHACGTNLAKAGSVCQFTTLVQTEIFHIYLMDCHKLSSKHSWYSVNE